MYYHVLNFFVNLFMKLCFRVKFTGLENIPSDGGIILCSNHISNFDGLALRLKIPRTINFMGKKELFANSFFSYTLKKFSVFPVDRSTNDLQAYKTAMKILKDGKILGIFVQGTRNKSKEVEGAKDGAAMFAMKTNSPIIPVGINATYNFFSTVHINIGEPIYFEASRKIDHDTLQMATSQITEQIKKLITPIKN